MMAYRSALTSLQVGVLVVRTLAEIRSSPVVLHTMQLFGLSNDFLLLVSRGGGGMGL